MINFAFICFQCSLCENSFCQQANLERHVKRHQQKYLQNAEGNSERNNIVGGSPGSASIVSQNEGMLHEPFSEEDDDDEIVDLETVSTD